LENKTLTIEETTQGVAIAQHIKKVIDFQNECVKSALIALGWTPPSMSDTIQSAERFAGCIKHVGILRGDEELARLIKSRDAAHIALGRELERTARAEDAETRFNDLIKACEDLSALMQIPMMLAGSSTVECNALDKMRAALSRLSAGEVEPDEPECPLCGAEMKEYITRYKCRVCHHEVKKPISPSEKE
jgi:ribosomal protein S27AE